MTTYHLTAIGMRWLKYGLGATDKAALADDRGVDFVLCWEAVLLHLLTHGPTDPETLRRIVRSLDPGAARVFPDVVGYLSAARYILLGDDTRTHRRYLRQVEGIPTAEPREKHAADIALQRNYSRAYAWSKAMRLRGAVTRKQLLDYADSLAPVGRSFGTKWLTARLARARVLPLNSPDGRELKYPGTSARRVVQDAVEQEHGKRG